MSQSTKMLEISRASTSPQMELGLMLLPAVSPAKILASQERALALTESVLDSGKNMQDLLASYDRNTQSWRTSQLCLTGGLSEYSETWPRSGMMQNGNVYLRMPSVPRTCETEFGSPLIPTPTACDHKGSGRLRLERGANNNLRDFFKINFGFLYPPVKVVEWLMGYDIDHTDSAEPAMRSSRKSLKSSGAQS